MRKYIYTALCSALVVMMFSACGGGNSSEGNSADSSDGLFGNVPSVVAKYAQKRADFQKEVEKKVAKMKDISEGAELAKESEAVDKEAEAKIDDAAQKLVGKKIPYEVSEGLFYTVASEPVITKSGAHNYKSATMEITYRASQKEAMEIARLSFTDYPICYKFVDAKEAPVWVSLDYIVMSNNEPVKFEAGQDYGRDFVITLSVTEKNVNDLKNAVKIIFIPKAEYDEVKKQLEGMK